MKTLRQLFSEVAQPRGEDEKHFKDKHIVTKKKHPVAPDEVFTGGIKKAAKRLADYDVGEDETVYEASAFDVPTAAGGEYDDEESHVRYKKGNKSVPLRKESRMDPVGQEDDDINNDGKVDDADRYLHRRRRAISKAIKKEAAEELDEAGGLSAAIKRAEASRQKALKKAASMVKKGFSHEVAAKNHDVKVDDLKRHMKEAIEELDEVSKDLLGRYATKAHNRGDMAARMSNHGRNKDMADIANKRYSGVQKAISKLSGRARVNATEEVEQIDEISDKKLDAYRQKAFADQPAGDDGSDKYRKRKFGRDLAFAKQTGRAKVRATKEEVELEEKAYVSSMSPEFGRKGSHDVIGKNGKIIKSYPYTKDGMKAAQAHLSKMKEEVEQIDEISKKTLASYAKKAGGSSLDSVGSHMVAYGTTGNKKHLTKAIKRAKGVERAIDRLAKEEVEQIDEISKKTLGSYVAKASSAAASDAAKYGQQGSSEKGLDHFRKAYSRLHNIKKAAARLAKEEAEQLDELSPNTLHSYIKKAAGNLAGNAAVAAAQASSSMKKSSPDVKRNIKNRMRGISGASGRLADKANADMYEDLDESIAKMSHGRLKFHMNTGTPHGSYSNDEMKAERDRRLKSGEGEAYRKAKSSLSEVTRSAVKRPVTYTDNTGRTRTRYTTTRPVQRDQYGQEKIQSNESFINEAFKAGSVRLNDGSSVSLKAEDAKLLNQMFKDLNERNRKTMRDTLMTDKSGFNEILSFAREAL